MQLPRSNNRAKICCAACHGTCDLCTKMNPTIRLISRRAALAHTLVGFISFQDTITLDGTFPAIQAIP